MAGDPSTWSIILGPPGTGKTTTILNLIELEMQKGTPPDRIGYFAFTKKASEEGRDRTMERFGLSSKELPNFRTLHSLCHRMLGLSRSSVLNGNSLREFNDIMGLRLSGRSDMEEGSITMLSKDDRLSFIEGLSRLRCVSLREQWHQHYDEDIDWFALERFQKGLYQFKQARGLHDFTDMLDLCVQKQLAPKLDVMFVDEAQDLSPLQWKLVELLANNSERVYIAGDDDQAIFRWAGADVDHLVALSAGNARVLDQSYRIPRSVHRIADKVIRRVKTRTDKVWNPRQEEGQVVSEASFEHVDLTVGDWLILSRSNYLLNELDAHCRNLGIYFERKGNPSVSEKKIASVKAWERLRRGHLAYPEDATSAVAYIKGAKKKSFDNCAPTERFTFSQVLQISGLGEPLIWHDMFDAISVSERSYMLSILRRGEKITGKPRVKLSTIHSAKGGEADNVLLLTDIPHRTWKNFEKNPDDDTRVFYVGLTRAKKNLHIVQPMSNKYFPM